MIQAIRAQDALDEKLASDMTVVCVMLTISWLSSLLFHCVQLCTCGLRACKRFP